VWTSSALPVCRHPLDPPIAGLPNVRLSAPVEISPNRRAEAPTSPPPPDPSPDTMRTPNILSFLRHRQIYRSDGFLRAMPNPHYPPPAKWGFFQPALTRSLPEVPRHHQRARSDGHFCRGAADRDPTLPVSEPGPRPICPVGGSDGRPTSGPAGGASLLKLQWPDWGAPHKSVQVATLPVSEQYCSQPGGAISGRNYFKQTSQTLARRSLPRGPSTSSTTTYSPGLA
jgi:hypothetical protein